MREIDLGAVSAYALAKERGYTGTEEEFAADQANAAKFAAETRENKEATECIRDEAIAARNEAVTAKNTAVENANTATNKAEETAADAVQTGNDRDTAKVYMNRAIEEASKAQEAYNNILTRLGAEPKKWFKTSIDEMNAITGMNPGDVCYIVDFASGRTSMYFWDTDNVDGDETNPEWIFLGNAEFVQMERTDLLRILNLATVAITGSYADLQNIPNRYNTPLVLDGTGETVAWDYGQGDTAIVTLEEDKALTITNAYNGCVACIQVYGAKLDFTDDTIYNKSATFDYIEPLEAEHLTYTLIYNAGKWDVTAMVYAGSTPGGEEDA